jgi:hypothetical protein
MSIARRLFALAIVAGCSAGILRAEVSAETDLFGNYIRTVVTSTSSVSLNKSLRVWSVARIRPTYWPLNPNGDFIGDLWPNIAENPVQSRWPWVTWSRFNGSDYDLAWSRWTGRGWSPLATVEMAPGDDDALDSAIAFDQVGRPYLVWVSKPRTGAAQVNVSMFLSTRWMAPFRVSDTFENATDPTITILPDGNIVVMYETAVGQVTREIRVTRPWTITDDITPFGTLSIADPRPSGPLNP